MKKIFTQILLLLFAFKISTGQVPGSIRYEGLYREKGVNIIGYRNIEAKATIFKNDVMEFEEFHPDIDSKDGEYVLNIGNGQTTTGNFSNIDWQSGKYTLKIELRTKDTKRDFIDQGTIQILTVPFAFQSMNSEPWLNTGSSLINSHSNVIVNGKLGVNTSKTDGDHKLYVDGSILCTELKVESVENWPDYVFNYEYNLMPIDSVKRFINKNGHLPNVPSKNEIIKGYFLGEMNKVLLRKIEELTLYIIELNSKIEGKK